MNNKGQTLVLFVIILPLLIFGMYFILNVGNLYTVKKSIDYNIKNAIKMRFSGRFTEDEVEKKINEIITKNVKNIKYLDIFVTNEKIIVNIEVNVDTNLPKIFNKSYYTIKSKYNGYNLNEQIIIEKE